MSFLKLLFRKKESGFTGVDPNGLPICVMCGRHQQEGHDPKCWFGKKLNG